MNSEDFLEKMGAALRGIIFHAALATLVGIPLGFHDGLGTSS
jgi:hypothetical protein